MRLASTFKIAFRALRRNKMRSTLTALGIIIGVGAVIAMVSIGNGAKAQVEAQIASLGQNVILIFAGSITSGGSHGGYGSSGTLKIDDAEAIKREIPEVEMISPELSTGVQVAAGNQNWYTRILGESEEYFDIRDWPFTEGAAFSEQDVRRANKVAVIGHTVAHQVYGDESPLGKILRVKNVPFTVVGVLMSKGFSLMGSDQDDVVVIPHTSHTKRVSGYTSLRSINVKVSKNEVLESTQQQIVSLLRQRHRITPGKDDDFTVRNQEEIAQTATATSRVMTMLLGSIAAVSLIVGGIGIMNIMLVSVTERTREIGIRMAVGAHGRDILLQFLIEAVTLSAAGGIIGILVGVTSSKVVAHIAHWPTLITLDPIVWSFLTSAAVGIFFGFYPARKASRLDPIEALRYE